MRLVLLAGVATLSLSAAAQTASEAPEKEQEQRQETISVYGTSNPIPVFEYPGQVTVIDRDAIDRLIPSTPADLMKSVPGVEFSGGPRRTGMVPSIRGLSGENVLILLDGARQSFISGHDGRFFLDPALIQSAEIVRGPASALYGSGAVGGVLAFETADAADLLREGESFGARVRAGYQSVNEESFGSLTAYGVQGGFDGVVNLSMRQSSDIELGSGADLPSDDEITSGLAKLGYQFTPALRGEVSWQGFSSTALEPNNGQGTGATGDPLLDRDVDKDIDAQTWNGGLSFNPDSDLIDARLTVYQQTTSVDEFDGTIPRTTGREIETTGFSARNAARFTLGNVATTLTFGGDWYEDSQTGFDTDTATGVRGGVPNASAEFMGVFAQLEADIEAPLGLPGNLILIPGVRFDEFESSSETATETASNDEVSPRFAASYGPVSWFRVFGSYAEGFRAPSVNELYLDGVHFSVPHPTLFNPAMGSLVFVNNNFIPNPNLKPETSETVELGFGVDFRNLATKGDRLQGKISWYESDVEDLINLGVDFTYDPTCFAGPSFFPCAAGTTLSDNVSSAELSGVELEAAYEAKQFYGRLTYSSIDGTDLTSGADLGTLTPDRASLDLGWLSSDEAIRMGTRFRIASDFERQDGAGGVVEERDGYSVVDLYASWAPGFATGLRFDAGIENLFEEDYERTFEGVSEPGRNFKIAASYQFGG
ncbi:MAG: TonB-dependent receptor [Ponticaulis sp.]|nr:TonB-dependent receptor [Ponticaulis sp.]|tara:strand:+ start:12372 stop:14501 length:2130 start_codon:yes stop_codon:yes gene_type:complete